MTRTIPRKRRGKNMKKENEIICTLILPRKYYLELSEEIRGIFEEQGGKYQTQFPADAEEDSFLGEYLQAFCEVVLIMNNPKYQVTEQCLVKSQLLKMGSSEEQFSMLVDIKYPEEQDPHNEVLVFQEVSQSLGYYTFELLGDQRIFAID